MIFDALSVFYFAGVTLPDTLEYPASGPQVAEKFNGEDDSESENRARFVWAIHHVNHQPVSGRPQNIQIVAARAIYGP